MRTSSSAEVILKSQDIFFESLPIFKNCQWEKYILIPPSHVQCLLLAIGWPRSKRSSPLTTKHTPRRQNRDRTPLLGSTRSNAPPTTPGHGVSMFLLWLHCYGREKKGAQFERGAENMETFWWIWMIRFSNLVLRRKKRFTPTPEISKTYVFLKFGFRSPQTTSENMVCMGKYASVSNVLYSKHIAVSQF